MPQPEMGTQRKPRRLRERGEKPRDAQEAYNARKERAAERKEAAAVEAETQRRMDELADMLDQIKVDEEAGRAVDDRLRVETFIDAYKILGEEPPQDLVDQLARLDEGDQLKAEMQSEIAQERAVSGVTAQPTARKPRSGRSYTPARRKMYKPAEKPVEQAPADDDTQFFRVETKPREATEPVQEQPAAEVQPEVVEKTVEQQWDDARRDMVQGGFIHPQTGEVRKLAPGWTEEQMKYVGRMQAERFQQVSASRESGGLKLSREDYNQEIQAMNAQIEQHRATISSPNSTRDSRQRAEDRIKEIEERKKWLGSQVSE